MAFQKRHWENVGAELPGAAVQAIFISDMLIKYWYIWSVLLTVVCALMWVSVGKDRQREESPD
jgi:hypothetical protein